MKVNGISWLLLQVCLVVSGVSGFSLSGLISQFHPLSISTSNSAQQFDGWGTSLSWFGEYVGSLEVAQQNRVADLLFDHDVGLGLEIIRYNLGGSNATLSALSSMRPGAAVPSMILADGSYDWSLDYRQAALLQAAHDRGALIFEAFSNSPPWFMTVSGDPSGNVGGADNLAAAYYNAYVDYLTEVVQYYQDEMNITFSTVEPFNEPSSKAWKQGNVQEGCHYEASTQRTILEKLAVSLTAKGLSETSISASDESDYGQSIGTFLQYGSALDVISQINTHSYPEAIEQLAQFPLETVATGAGKRIWMSEYASGNYAVSDIRTGLDLSVQILGDLKIGKVQAWVYWQAVEDSNGAGALWGLLQMPFNDTGPGDIPIQMSKQYYAMLQFTKFIKNGWTILDTTQDDRTLAAMYLHEDSSTEVAVVTTNTGTSSTTTNWNFGSTSPLQYTLEVYRTSTSENCARVADTLLPTSGLLQYDLPAQSITTFHFTFVAESTTSAVATAG